MKKIIAYLVLIISINYQSFAQPAAGEINPFVNAVDLTPDNSPGLALGIYSCGDALNVSFNIGQTTNLYTMPDVALNAVNRLEVDICLIGCQVQYQ
ncbi:MAG: hypothetical protein IPF70_16660 [Saprospiraceae bacterium]|nr:hypothetical protein [Saprospiraceae bacterium]